MPLPSDHDQRLARARLALEGLSVGDSFGGFFEFGSARRVSVFIQERKLPAAPWHFTDDSNMALSIFQILRQYREINQDALVTSFAQYFDRTRGYGMGARSLLTRLKAGESDWRSLTQKMFGSGSYGNGGAMRVAPVGAYFADADLSQVAQQAALSAEITHAHPEGIAGALAVAVATALAWRIRETGEPVPTRQVFIDRVIPHIPAGEVRTRCEQTRDLSDNLSLIEVVKTIGNGSGVTAQDTVPFVLWSAGENLTDYEEAMWQTAMAGGDVDTTCAMVGGIVAMAVGYEGIPASWIANREPLPVWAFVDQ